MRAGAYAGRRRWLPRSLTASSTPTAASTCSHVWMRASARTPRPRRRGPRPRQRLKRRLRGGHARSDRHSAHPGAETRLIENHHRKGKAENDSTLLRESKSPYCLLLNEDSELRPGATAALLAALESDPTAAAAGAQLPRSGRAPPNHAPGASPASRPRSPFALPPPSRQRSERRQSDPACRMGPVLGDARAHGRFPPRSGSSIPSSSSTPTRPTSRSAFTTPAGASSTSPLPRPSITSSSQPTAAPARPALSSSTAAATSICESTTATSPPPSRARSRPALSAPRRRRARPPGP